MKKLKNYADATLNDGMSRRKFLSGSAAIGASAVAVALAPNVAAATTKTDLKVEDKKEEGYQLTQHIADYYKSAAL